MVLLFQILHERLLNSYLSNSLLLEQTQKCEPSSGAGASTCIAAAVSYAGAAMVFFWYIADNEQGNVGSESVPSGEKVQLQSNEGAITVGNETMRRDNDCEVACSKNPQSIANKDEADDDVTHIASFETSVPVPTLTSSSQGRENNSLLDTDQNNESISLDVPYKETVDIEEQSCVPCDLIINAEILNDLEQHRQQS